MNRRQRAARALRRKAEMSNAFNDRQDRLNREAIIKANRKGLSDAEKLEGRAWRGVKSSVHLVESGCSPEAGRKTTDFFRPSLSKGEKPRYEGTYSPIHNPK